MKEIKQKADELVNMFSNNQIYLIKNRLGKLTSPYKSGYLAIKTRDYEALNFAILHQERLIEEYQKNLLAERTHNAIWDKNFQEQKEVLTELKSRL